MRPSSLLRALVSSAALAVAPSLARAVTQPDGTVIPVGNGLQTLFTSRGETINALSDGAVRPERFVPGCRLRFELVTRGPALFRNSFGWYNVDPTGARPADSDLHALIPCDATPGFVATLDLRTETAYRGGEIGFFLRTPQRNGGTDCAGGDCCGRPGHEGYTYYTERSFNPDTMASGSYIHLLTYDSRVTPQSFYFAWEDLYAGGDNNFTDFIARVDNIVCSGAGASCNTGMSGVCAQGAMQCRAGMLACVPSVRSSTERCDGLDNDCNGMTDEGNLCPVGQVCDRGNCVPQCVEGACDPGQQCVRGVCVESACAAVTCPAGQRCAGGACAGACDGVVCPAGQQCRAGRCVDPCDGVTCDMDQACVDGLCQPRCECRRCASGLTCGAAGRCAPTACATVSCPTGSVCNNGMCQDACTGVRCPAGEVCSQGTCAAPRVDAGAPEAGRLDASREASAPDAGTPDALQDAARADLGVAQDGGSWGGGARGCGCRAPGDAGRGRAWAGLLALGAALVVARRRRV